MRDFFTMLAYLAVLQHLGCSANECKVKPGPLRWVCTCEFWAEQWATALSEARP